VEKDRDAKFLEALQGCQTPEELEKLMEERFGDTDALVMPRSITITYQCSLCSSQRPTRQVVKTTAKIESHTLLVSICGMCEENLAKWAPAELARILMNFMRYGQLRPEQVKWIRLGGDITSQMSEMGFMRVPIITEKQTKEEDDE